MKKLLIILLMLNLGFSKLITISNHTDEADIYRTEDIINVGQTGSDLWIYYYKRDDNPMQTFATKYQNSLMYYIKTKTHKQLRFNSFDEAYKEFQHILKELNNE